MGTYTSPNERTKEKQICINPASANLYIVMHTWKQLLPFKQSHNPSQYNSISVVSTVRSGAYCQWTTLRVSLSRVLQTWLGQAICQKEDPRKFVICELASSDLSSSIKRGRKGGGEGDTWQVALERLQSKSRPKHPSLGNKAVINKKRNACRSFRQTPVTFLSLSARSQVLFSLWHMALFLIRFKRKSITQSCYTHIKATYLSKPRMNC